MEDKKVDQYYSPPPILGKWEGFRIFIWNSETGQFMGRTGASWAKILLFYVIFYAVLCGFFGAMLAVFYQTLDPNAPKWQLERSIIGTNPGLGFRPMPPDSNVDSSLIWYKANDEQNYRYWTKELDRFLAQYDKATLKPGTIDTRVPCDYTKPSSPGKVCNVDLEAFRVCQKNNSYSFHKGTPCIFLKLNKIFGWTPNIYNVTDNLPNNMPDDLKSHVKSLIMQRSPLVNTVWVTCEGESPADNENIGAINYIPQRGFPGYYFPFNNTPGYLSPLVAVHFEGPKRGVLINIECKAWAHNIIHDRFERRGSVHFELMVD